MKPVFTRVLVFLLTVCMLSTAFCACGDTDQPAEPTGSAAVATTAEEATETEGGFVFHEVDYGNETFRIFGCGEKYSMLINILSEEYTGEAISDAKYRAEATVEDKYKIQLEEYRCGWDNQLSELNALVASDDHTYDVAYLRSTHVASQFTAGHLNNLCNLSSIDITKEWWDQKAREDGTLGNKVLYYLVSDAQLMGFDGTWCVYFNKKLFDDRNMAYPYATVRSQNWTFEELYRLAHETASVNNSSNPASFDAIGDTFYGMASFKNFINAALVGCGEFYCKKDADGIPYYAMGQSTTVADVADRIVKLTGATADATYITTNSSGKHYMKDVFSQERSLLGAGELKEARSTLAEMGSPFGIVPIPKYSADQDGYHSNMLWSTLLLTIPTFCSDVDRAAVVMDALSYLAMEEVLPKYYERVCYRGLSDNDSISMLEIIRESRYLNWALAYGWLKPVEANMNTLLDAGDSGVASLIASTKEEVEALMGTTVDLIRAME